MVLSLFTPVDHVLRLLGQGDPYWTCNPGVWDLKLSRVLCTLTHTLTFDKEHISPPCIPNLPRSLSQDFPLDRSVFVPALVAVVLSLIGGFTTVLIKALDEHSGKAKLIVDLHCAVTLWFSVPKTKTTAVKDLLVFHSSG